MTNTGSIMTSKPNLLPIVLVATCCLAFSVRALALDLSGNKRQDITDAEWAMAPPYCPYTMGQKGHKQPHIGKWVGVMGDGFFHMHHHCWALFDLRRSERAGLSAADKKFLLGRALGGFQYVVRHTEDDFILLPEVYTWIGRTEIRLGRPKNAGEAFSRAQELKADYWPPYFHWAEYLQGRGKKAEALEVVRSGLQFSPGAKPLLLLYRQLGGKPSDIPPPKSHPDSKSADEDFSPESSQDEPEPRVQ